MRCSSFNWSGDLDSRNERLDFIPADGKELLGLTAFCLNFVVFARKLG